VDAARQDGADLVKSFDDDRTVMTLTLASPLQPGAQAVVELDFHAQLPRVFARTGFGDNDFFMVGQWFPKVAVYDDLGWHSWPFHANAEFFADFGTYDVDITVPKNYIVGATGTRTRTQDQGELEIETYHAQDVIDFAWTASPHYRTATRRAGNVDITLLYQPENQRYVERYLRATEQALEAYGQWYYPYPYPRITVVDPPSAASGASGMEYPMLVTGGVGALGIPEVPGATVREAEVVVLHEMGHQWFYATLATNEAEEPWLDEGFADFSTLEAATRYYGLKTSMIGVGGAGLGYGDMRRLEYSALPRVPTYGKAWDFGMLEYGVAAYSKPDVVLATLKNILGAETFARVMKTYAERYRFKHPRTEDFIAVAQEVSGQNLKWFFDQAVYGRGVLDYAVESASTRRAEGGDYHSEVVLARKGEVTFPMDLLVAFGDGTVQRQVWDGQAVSQTLTFDTPAPLSYAALDPDKKLVMELDSVDNSLTVQPAVAPLARFASRWLFWMQAILDFGS
jgi:aminopeptidase N